jgi:hypothetical protein
MAAGTLAISGVLLRGVLGPDDHHGHASALAPARVTLLGDREDGGARLKLAVEADDECERGRIAAAAEGHLRLAAGLDRDARAVALERDRQV